MAAARRFPWALAAFAGLSWALSATVIAAGPKLDDWLAISMLYIVALPAALGYAAKRARLKALPVIAVLVVNGLVVSRFVHGPAFQSPFLSLHYAALAGAMGGIGRVGIAGRGR